MTALTGGFTNYYLVEVKHPQRKDKAPYQAECEDITSALKMTPNEFCEFKAIWRTAAARLGNGKPGQKAVYDAEKRVHYATRSLFDEQLAAGLVAESVPEPEVDWVLNREVMLRLMAGMACGKYKMSMTTPGQLPSSYLSPLETFHLGSSDVHFWPTEGKPDPSTNWLSWKGGRANGPLELSASDLVEVQIRSGNVLRDRVSFLRWNHSGESGDIFAYRLVGKKEDKA